MECLKSENIKLRALEPEDLEILYRWENIPSLWDVGDSTEPISRYAIKEYIAYSNKNIFEKGELRLMIVRQEDNASIGCIDIYNFDIVNHRAGIGILIDPTYQRNGYASEALNLIKAYAKEYLQLHLLYAYVTEDNIPSKKLFEACNFLKQGVLKDWKLTSDNKYKHVIIYSIVFPL